MAWIRWWSSLGGSARLSGVWFGGRGDGRLSVALVEDLEAELT